MTGLHGVRMPQLVQVMQRLMRTAGSVGSAKRRVTSMAVAGSFWSSLKCSNWDRAVIQIQVRDQLHQRLQPGRVQHKLKVATVGRLILRKGVMLRDALNVNLLLNNCVPVSMDVIAS